MTDEAIGRMAFSTKVLLCDHDFEGDKEFYQFNVTLASFHVYIFFLLIKMSDFCAR